MFGASGSTSIEDQRLQIAQIPVEGSDPGDRAIGRELPFRVSSRADHCDSGSLHVHVGNTFERILLAYRRIQRAPGQREKRRPVDQVARRHGKVVAQPEAAGRLLTRNHLPKRGSLAVEAGFNDATSLDGEVDGVVARPAHIDRVLERLAEHRVRKDAQGRPGRGSVVGRRRLGCCGCGSLADLSPWRRDRRHDHQEDEEERPSQGNNSHSKTLTGWGLRRQSCRPVPRLLMHSRIPAAQASGSRKTIRKLSGSWVTKVIRPWSSFCRPPGMFFSRK